MKKNFGKIIKEFQKNSLGICEEELNKILEELRKQLRKTEDTKENN